MSERPKRNSKTPTRFNPEAAVEKVEKAEKKKKVPVKKTRATKKGKGKKEKDPNAPKRAKTAYIIFATEERPRAKAVRNGPTHSS
jgi:structure-specific recognition protein 1